MNGVLFINKPKGMTSRDVVNEICHIFKTKKVGHTGTLDPLASGVLIVCLGSYTKLVDLFTSYDKEYIATMKFGIHTDTLDITGNILKIDNKTLLESEIKNAFLNFPKTYFQEVPAYSAIKVNGKKLYEYAREGVVMPLPRRSVSIYSLEILSIHNDEVSFKTHVSKGTYIRSLIRDLADSISSCAVMSDLIRSKQGDVSLDDCISLEELHYNTSLKTITNLFSYPTYEVDESLKTRIFNGNQLLLDSFEKRLIMMYHGKAIAIYEKDGDVYKILFRENFL